MPKRKKIRITRKERKAILGNSDDTYFGRCIDSICEDAMDSGVSFVELEDDDF